jgi:hypothetical protein
VVDSLVDAASGTFGVFLAVPNPKLDIPTGVKCRAEFPMLSNATKDTKPASRNNSKY